MPILHPVIQIFLPCPRFSPNKRSRAYSTGAVYVTILNNPRCKRFLPQETMLYCVIPGPHEPTSEQLNSLTEPLFREFQELYKGEHAVCVEGRKQRSAISGLSA